MLTTSHTLLQKLREPDQPRAWDRFVDLYTPLLMAWARRAGLQVQDAADLVQDVFTTLMVQLPKFQYDAEKKNFRGWLRTVCLNKWRDRGRRRENRVPNAGEQELEELQAPSELERFWDREHDQHLVRQALLTMQELRQEFKPTTVDAVVEVLVNGRSPADVAREFGITENTIYLGKVRILRRLRQELSGFLE